MPRIGTEVFHGNAWNDTEGLPRNNTEFHGKCILKIYIDTSVYNRPFDDQAQPRIWLETLSLSKILQMVSRDCEFCARIWRSIQ
jgi:hypothetical protein